LKKCQLAGLVAPGFAYLGQLPLAIGILISFHSTPAFRDTVIEHDPEILEKLLRRATKGYSDGAEN
jgi:hypothetical protein